MLYRRLVIQTLLHKYNTFTTVVPLTTQIKFFVSTLPKGNKVWTTAQPLLSIKITTPQIKVSAQVTQKSHIIRENNTLDTLRHSPTMLISNS